MLFVLHCTRLNFIPSNNLHFLVQTYVDNLSSSAFSRKDMKLDVNTDEYACINKN